MVGKIMWWRHRMVNVCQPTVLRHEKGGKHDTQKCENFVLFGHESYKSRSQWSEKINGQGDIN